MKHTIVDKSSSDYVLCLFEFKEGKKDVLRSRDYLHIERGAKGKSTILKCGLGDPDGWSHRRLAKVIRKLVRFCQSERIDRISFDPAVLVPADWTREKTLEWIATQAELASYSFNSFKSKPKGGWPKLKEISYLAANDVVAKKALQAGRIIGESTNVARELSNMPGGEMTPTLLTEKVLAHSASLPLDITVFGEKEMKELSMGGILGVSRGSVEEAQFIIVNYSGADDAGEAPYVFVGKGVTYDSGGLDLKPSHGMGEMHMDMSGAASVFGALLACARLGIKRNIVGVLPAAENMPSGGSYRNGDILKMMSGKTVEVISTDAEGRIILADALTYIEKNYKPFMVVDVATLTGACLSALGLHASAVMSTDEDLLKSVQPLGEQSGDYVWPLPLWEEYDSMLKSDIADIANLGKRTYGGAINGGVFLKQFAGSFKKWLHVDIASTMTPASGDHLASGSTGAGTRLLIEIARNYQ